jgi:hypothetical protein
VEYRAAIDRFARERGRPTLLRLMLAYSPLAQEAMNDLYYPVVQNGRVSRRLEESLLVAPSDARVCRYCVGGHSLFLVNEFGYDQDAVRQMRSGGRHDGWTDAETALVADCRRDHIRPAVGDAGGHCRAVPPLLVRRRDRRGAGHGQSLSLDDHGSSGPAPRRRPGNTRIRRLLLAIAAGPRDRPQGASHVAASGATTLRAPASEAVDQFIKHGVMRWRLMAGTSHRSPAIGTALPYYRRGPARPPRHGLRI